MNEDNESEGLGDSKSQKESSKIHMMTVNHKCIFQALLSFFGSFSWVQKSISTNKVYPKFVLGIANQKVAGME